jgi:2-dehydro-3-deoxyphosphogluconate aldolase / (4S)-4-hydroxy-2-oxoglutarate aldolase
MRLTACRIAHDQGLASMPDDSGKRSDLPPELAASGVMAVLRVHRPEFLPVLAGYLWDAGVGTIEIPAATEDFELAISVLGETAATVGAGDVVDVGQTQIAVRAGARFVSSPFAARDVLRLCVDSGVAAIPFASTPGEVEAVWADEAAAVKVLSPGLERVAHAFPGVPLIAVGSVDEHSAAGYIRAGACAVAADGWLLADAADGGSLEEFGRRARQLVTAVAASSPSSEATGSLVRRSHASGWR